MDSTESILTVAVYNIQWCVESILTVAVYNIQWCVEANPIASVTTFSDPIFED